MFEEYAQKRNPLKLAQRHSSAYREMMTAEQNGIDFITGRPLTDPVIDHDHDPDKRHCRLILNKSTNTIEGDFNRILSGIADRKEFTSLLWEVYFGSYVDLYDELFDAANERRNGYLEETEFWQMLKQFAVYYAIPFNEINHLEYYR
ncbi:hypothetical protein JBO41_03245 [Enterobacter asburiae]|uniref:hypothetical protein n=1 Tax=Enterobacteriaceae TaxID=543 RepID=UPI00192C0E36|nr:MULTISPECIES: hypothetical protein [Enterobacteriaceae]MBL5911034.1 hypothetical protein [Enterobacter asburiae]MBL5915669.1 hypothetical protein [Enterobacter asburiae]MCS0562689.1 hypothetical protein [Citrobacter freundii]MDH1544269.1 hypothetical protein [Enterobacter ludwigii]